jgi:hypothetical protein
LAAHTMKEWVVRSLAAHTMKRTPHREVR